MHRRDFLSAAAAGLALSAAGPFSKNAQAFADAKPKRVGLIGTGWYGKCDLWRLVQVAPVEIVSLCDVNKRNLEEAAKTAAERQRSKKTPRLYSDYRKMLAEKDLDIVEIATPDHWHALAAIAAMEAGADLYLQKPISVDVVEGQAILAAARKLGRVVQVGTQRRSTPHLIEARNEIVKAGKLGKVGVVEIYCYGGGGGNAPDTAPPAYLDYEMWTGPAPMRPYCNMGWRQFMEYGNGTVGDMGIHMLDMVRWMLDLGWPKRISSSGGIFVNKKTKANISDTQSITFDFGDLEVIWQHRHWGARPDPDYWWGGNFYGDRGTLKASVFRYDFTPSGRGQKTIHKDFVDEKDKYPEDKDEKRLEIHCAPAIRYHMLDLLSAIEKRSKPVADIEQGHISTACCILGNISMQLGRTLAYDPATGQIPGDEEATRLLHRPYRSPWAHPEPGKWA